MGFPLSPAHTKTGRAPTDVISSSPDLEFQRIPTFSSGSCSKTFPVPCASCSSGSLSSFYFGNVKFLFLKCLFGDNFLYFGVCCTLHFSFPSHSLLPNSNGTGKIENLKKKVPISLSFCLAKLGILGIPKGSVTLEFYFFVILVLIN